jgi:hypothetical protein
MPMSGSADGGTACDSDNIQGLEDLIAFLNDHGEVLLGLPDPGTQGATNHIAGVAGPVANPCIAAAGSGVIAVSNAVACAAAEQRTAAAAAAAKPQRARQKKLSSGKKVKLELEHLLKEHQLVCLQLQSLQLDNRRLRLKQALLHAINQAKQQLLDVLWQHRASTGSSTSSKCNDCTISALQELEQQVQQLLQASATIAAPSEDASSSSATNGTSGSMHSSWQTSSSTSSQPYLASAASGAAMAAPLQQEQSALQQASQPSSLQEQQQQQQQSGSSDDADGWCPDPLQDPLWLLKRGMAHLDLSLAVNASREERLVAWKHVQGQVSLLLRAIEDDAGTWCAWM